MAREDRNILMKMKKNGWNMKAAISAAIIAICGFCVPTACSSNDDNPGTKEDDNAKKALLIILDGWGIGDKGEGDVIYQTATPYID